MGQYLLSNEKLYSQLAKNPNVVNEFQFLKRVLEKAPPDDCPDCQRKKYETEYRQACEQTKQIIASLAPADVVRLKQLLGLPPGTSIVIYYLDNNKTIERTI